MYPYRPDTNTSLAETTGALAHTIRSGKAPYVGRSNDNAEQTARAARLLRELGPPGLIHPPSDHRFERSLEHSLTPVGAE